jgi:hypothetical protein
MLRKALLGIVSGITVAGLSAVFPSFANAQVVRPKPPIFVPPPRPRPVPEIDPNAARGSLVLLMGGVMLLVDRRRKR